MTPARDELVARVTRSLDTVRARVTATGRDPDEVTIVAVCKGHGPDAVLAARAAGLVHVADNYAAELVEHHDAVAASDAAAGGASAALAWHFLGALQRNKLARLAPRVAVYESLASARDAALVARHATGAACYVQVEVTGRPGRSGCARGEVGEVVAAARTEGLAVLGLMCVASPDPSAAELEFSWLRRTADALGLGGCSMGMSGDFEAACRAGATALRLGTALFGPRASRAAPGLA